VSPVRFELGYISTETQFFIVTAVKASNLTNPVISIRKDMILLKYLWNVRWGLQAGFMRLGIGSVIVPSKQPPFPEDVITFPSN
jgi:hypothetical protein